MTGFFHCTSGCNMTNDCLMAVNTICEENKSRRRARFMAGLETLTGFMGRSPDFGSSGNRVGDFGVLKAKEGPVDIGFWRLGPARKFGIMGDGEIGQGTASAVGWIFVLGLSGARDRSWRIW